MSNQKQYSTGFISLDTDSRIKQGLPSQVLANNNDCGYTNSLMSNHYYNNAMFPLKFPYVYYGPSPVKDDCLCLLNLRSP